jgi:hypothetical protein
MPSKSPKECIGLFVVCTPWIYLFDGVSSTPNRHRMQNLHPQEINVSTNNIMANKPFGISSFGVRILDVYGFLIDYLC